MAEKLGLEHQLILEEKFKLLTIDISEYTFANLYLFRTIHDYEILFERGELFVKGKSREGFVYLMPTSSPDRWPPGMVQLLTEQSACLYPIPREWLSYFEKDISQVSFSEAENDYLFLSKKIAHYSGRHLSKKRNQVKQFLEHHRVESRPLFGGECQHVLQILESWQQESDQTRQETDYDALVQAIASFDRLHLHGKQYFVDGKPSGFMIGEQLNSDCYVLHFVKAAKQILGLYQYMYQDLALTLEDQYKYINLEQDLGMPTIRQAKHSYQPDRFEHKYRIYLSGDNPTS
ncbi:MAG: DUF2156 domain-containing protein [Chlamydiales bacterium]